MVTPVREQRPGPGPFLSRARLGAALAIGVLCSLVARPTGVLAHAVLLRTTPSPAQTLAQAPREVSLLFSEPIDPVFTTVRVDDGQGQRIDLSDAHVDAQDDHLLVASLRPSLPNGVYTVSWRSLSTIDIHPDQGRYALFVGVPVSTDPRANSAMAGATATTETTLARWWFYIAASLFGGLLATWKVVLSGVLVGRHADVRASVRGRTRRVIVLAGVLLIVGTLFAAVAQAAAAADMPLLGGVGQPLSDLLLRGRYATIWWPRVGLEFVSLLLIAIGGLEGLAADCALATLPAVLLTSSLTSHGAALSTGPGPGILIDWLHIVGATGWVGSLIGLLMVLPEAQRSAAPGLVRAVLRLFFRFALGCSAIVVLSGSLQAALELGSLATLMGTPYGQLVLVKVALVAVMLALALVNEWRGRRTKDRPVGLRRGVRAELALGVVVLAVAAILSGTPPNRQPTLPSIAGASEPLSALR